MPDRAVEGTLQIGYAGSVADAIVELPPWYLGFEGSVSVWTAYSTAVVHNKLGGTTMPFRPGWPATHYLEVGQHDDIVPGEYRHPECVPDLLAIKPFGEPRQWYRLVSDQATVDASAGGEK